MHGSCKSFTCTAGLVWWGHDLEGYICCKQGENILTSKFSAFHLYRVTRNLVISHRHVDLEWTSCLLWQVNFSSPILKLVKFVTVTLVTNLLPPMTFDFCSGLVGWRPAAEDDSFQRISKREPQLLLLCAMQEKPVFCRGVSEGAENRGGLACFVWGRLRTLHFIKGKKFSLDSALSWAWFTSQILGNPFANLWAFHALRHIILFASLCPTSKLSSLWKPRDR